VSNTAQHDVVIVGAGLAGLRCAQVLSHFGLDVAVVEQADHVGGRVHSYDVDGYVVDEGFQLINPAYPELRATGVLPALDLRRFPGLLTFRTPEGQWTLADPRRAPWRAAANVVRRHPGLHDSLALGRLFATARFSSASALARVPDTTTREGFRAAGVSARTINDIITPFLQGTLLDSELETSWRYTRLLLKSFASGRPATPPRGARQLPASLAAAMPTVTIELNNRARSITPTSVTTDRGVREARAVVVATDQDNAAWLTGGGVGGWRATTTWWFATPRVPHGERLRLDLVRRSVSSMLDLASVAPERAPAHRSLIAVAVNGTHDAQRDLEIATDVARFYGLDRASVELVARTTVPHSLPRVTTPLSLTTSPRRGELFVAGDYLQTPSIQGALVSGRRAADAVLTALNVSRDNFWPRVGS
jgi:glycine/D-amino acid oxidase-like deaminating enzyme